MIFCPYSCCYSISIYTDDKYVATIEVHDWTYCNDLEQACIDEILFYSDDDIVTIDFVYCRVKGKGGGG